MSSLKSCLLDLLKRAEREEAREVSATYTRAGSACSSTAQFLSASGEPSVIPGKSWPSQHHRFLQRNLSYQVSYWLIFTVVD